MLYNFVVCLYESSYTTFFQGLATLNQKECEHLALAVDARNSRRKLFEAVTLRRTEVGKFFESEIS